MKRLKLIKYWVLVVFLGFMVTTEALAEEKLLLITQDFPPL